MFIDFNKIVVLDFNKDGNHSISEDYKSWTLADFVVEKGCDYADFSVSHVDSFNCYIYDSIFFEIISINENLIRSIEPRTIHYKCKCGFWSNKKQQFHYRRVELTDGTVIRVSKN